MSGSIVEHRAAQDYDWGYSPDECTTFLYHWHKGWSLIPAPRSGIPLPGNWQVDFMVRYTQ